MDAIEQLKDDLISGRIDPNRLVDVIATVQRELQVAQQRITELEQRNAELEKQLAATSTTAKVDEYSGPHCLDKKRAFLRYTSSGHRDRDTSTD